MRIAIIVAAAALALAACKPAAKEARLSFCTDQKEVMRTEYVVEGKDIVPVNTFVYQCESYDVQCWPMGDGKGTCERVENGAG